MSAQKLLVAYTSLLLGVAIVFVALSISNYLIHRNLQAANDDPEFKAVSDILVRKCADCHSSDLSVMPVYANWPIAGSIIQKNIKDGRASFLLSRDKLSGREKMSAGDIERLSQAMAKSDMPPVQYIFLHWDAMLNKKEQKLLVDWIRKRSGEFDIRPIPEDNFFKPDLKKAKLGELLFFDKRLSDDNSVSCASCHNFACAGANNLQYAEGVGHRKSSFNTPSVFNAAYNFAQYWDGRAKNLKAQALDAVTNKDEMASSWTRVLGRLEQDRQFRERFSSVFTDGLTPANIASAIAEYEHTLLTPGSRFDRYLAGDSEALSRYEAEGFEIFKKNDCASCHAGPALGGLSFEKMGSRKDYFDTARPEYSDNGKFNVSKSENDRYFFKVPSLRNVELTYPYFHDGSAKTLEAAVRIMSEYQGKKQMTEDELKKVTAFLRTLTASTSIKKLSKMYPNGDKIEN